MFDIIINPSKQAKRTPDGPPEPMPARRKAMIFIFVLMIALCFADFVSDRLIGLVRKAREPRLRLVRARQYRFN